MSAYHGVPETMVTDNGRQFTAGEFQRSSDQWGFTHRTTSPYLPQKSTPAASTGVSPAGLAMGRRLRSALPTLSSNLNPSLHDRAAVSTADAKKKAANEHYFHKRHGAHSLPELQPGDSVLQKLDDEKGWSSPATVLNRCASRS